MADLNRRRFLKTTTALGLAGLSLDGLVPGTSRVGSAAEDSAAEDRPRRRFKKDLACGMIQVRADQREAIRFAHQFGFEAVDPNTGFLLRLSDTELAELQAELKAKNLAWGAAGLPVDFRGDEARFKAGVQRLPEMAKGLQRAGVTRVATWLTPVHGSLTYLANFRQHARRLREVAKVLGDHGQRIGLEYVGPKTSWTRGRYPFIHTMAEMKDLIGEIDQDNVGFLLDSWHWYTAHETQADLLTLTNHDVVACHLNDAPKDVEVDQQQDNTRELPCATGVIDVEAFLGGLAKIGYDGPVCAEPFYRPLRNMPREKALEVVAAAMNKAFALVE